MISKLRTVTRRLLTPTPSKTVLACALVALIGLAGCTLLDQGGWMLLIFLMVLFGEGVGGAVSGPGAVPPPKAATAPVASAPTTLVLGAAAHVAGAADTDWRSDCEVLCTGPEACAFTIAALMHGGDNSNPPSRDYTLAAGTAMRLDDVLLAEFGRDGKAALRVTATAGSVIATNRTYNLLAAGNALGLPAGSTFGQYIPAVRADDAIAFGEEGRLVQLSHITTGGGFRTNLGLVNVTGISTQVRIRLFSADGDEFGTVSRTLAPFEYRQIGNVFAGVTSSDVANGYAVVSTTTEAGRFLAQASVVDNATGDPVFVPAQRLLQGAGAKAVRPPTFITATAHIRGAADTNWRTDVELHNPTATATVVTVELLEHGRDNSDPASETVSLAAEESRRIEDVLSSLFGFSGKAALRLSTDGGEVVVGSRTYNLLGAKNLSSLPAGSTFGQYIPAVTEAEAIHRGDTGTLIQLAQSADDASGFRANLALVNARTTPVAVDVTAFSADGTSLGSFAVELRALEYQQINSVFREVTAAAVADGYLEVSTQTDGGAFFALASVVDNLTGDPVGMLHARVVAAGAQGLVEGTSALFDVLGGTVGDDGEPVGLADVVAVVQGQGVNALVAQAASAYPNGSSAGGVMTADFGGGWTDVNGAVHTGSMELDLSGLSVTGSSITGTARERHLDHLVNGEPPSLGWVDADFDLDVDGQGEVQGTITVSGGPATSAAKTTSTATLGGNIVVDTILCKYFPTGGSLTFTIGDLSTTVTFTPSCDGAFDYSSESRFDWTWEAKDPEDAESQTYIESTSNAVIRTEGQFRFWQPEVGAETIGETTPGVVIYRFPFDRPVLAARGFFGIHTFHWSYSQGHGYFYASADGSSWVLLDEAEPPDFGGYARCGVNIDVPADLLGGTELWFKIELYSYGPSAGNGGALANTAQFARYDDTRDNVTVSLKADLE